MIISLMGYMGSGKSAAANRLAQDLGIRFIDLDDAIEENQKKSISEIFLESGPIRFRKIEKEVLTQILNSDHDFVLALGGGTPAYYDNLDLIKKHSRTVYLRTKISTLIERLESQKESRPLLSHLNMDEMPEFIAKHLFERRNFYEAADFTVDTDNKTIQEISAEIIHLLRQ